ncbi:MAG: MFS transporter [Thermomicrobiales bacterium]
MELSDKELRRGFFILALTAFSVSLSMGLQQSISPNFYRETIGMDGAQNGYLVAFREIPGFLLAFVAALLLRLGMARATGLALLIMGVGYASFSFGYSFTAIIVSSVIGSIGFHSWLQMQYALGLSLARSGEEGSVLGRVSSIGFSGRMLGMIGVLIVLQVVGYLAGAKEEWQGTVFRALFIVCGVSAVVGGITILRFPAPPNERAVARAAPKITLRRDYWLYYLLSFLDGCRMEIYFAFAPFVLVEEFGVSATAITILLICAGLLNWRTAGWIGRLIDKHGEKRMLTINYCGHFVVFLGFALAQNVWLLYAFYLGYNFLFTFSIGTTTYLRKIARKDDIAPSLAMGVSWAHVAAVAVPVVGAALWTQLGYQFPFLFGTSFVLLSIWFTRKIDVPRQRLQEPASIQLASAPAGDG